jgi:hypothetical protein
MNIWVDAALDGHNGTASTADVNSGYWNPAGLIQKTINCHWCTPIILYSPIRLHRVCKSHWRPQCLGYFANPFGSMIFWTLQIDRQSRKHWLQSHQSFFYGWLWFHLLMLENYPFRISYGVNAKNKKDYRKFADSWDLDLMSDFSLKKGLEIRINGSHITTTYNVEYRKGI